MELRMATISRDVAYRNLRDNGISDSTAAAASYSPDIRRALEAMGVIPAVNESALPTISVQNRAGTSNDSISESAPLDTGGYVTEELTQGDVDPSQLDEFEDLIQGQEPDNFMSYLYALGGAAAAGGGAALANQVPVEQVPVLDKQQARSVRTKDGKNVYFQQGLAFDNKGALIGEIDDALLKKLLPTKTYQGLKAVARIAR